MVEVTTPPNKPVADMSISELEECLEWNEQYPEKWWSNKVGYSEQQDRDYKNVMRLARIAQIEEELALRRKGRTDECKG